MTFYQRKLTDEDLKTIEDHGMIPCLLMFREEALG